jgi:hypothetical protein
MATTTLVPDARNINQLYSWCNSMSAEKRQARGYYPNEVYWPKDKADARVIIVSRRSPRSDFALNEAAQRKASGLEAYVWLAEPNGDVVARDTVENVLARLADLAPLNGRWGPYWWVDQNFNPPSMQVDDSAPF